MIVSQLLSTDHNNAVALVQWIRDGVVQHESGGFCGWLDGITGRLSPPYPEITGYVLNALAQYPLEHTELKRTKLAAAWLTQRAATGNFAARLGMQPDVYSFDVAMIAHGLIRFGIVFEDDDAVQAGLQNAEFLVTLARNHGFLPTTVSRVGQIDTPQTWSTHGRAHMAKTVQSLLSADQLGLAGALTVARTLVNDALSASDPVETCPSDSSISLHAVCYSAEGLWIWGNARQDAVALRRSRELTEWVWLHCDSDGCFPGFVHRHKQTRPHEWQSDVQAQALRLAVLHNLNIAKFPLAMNQLVRGIWKNGAQAAVLYRPGTDDVHLNTWASLFAAQACALASGTRERLKWWELV